MGEQRWMRKRDGDVLPRHTMMHPCCEDLYEKVTVEPVNRAAAKRLSFKPIKSFAGSIEPGDCTHYEMAVVEQWDVYEVVVLNDGFFDKLTFLKCDLTFYHSHREDGTNPWTIKAAAQFLDMYLEVIE